MLRAAQCSLLGAQCSQLDLRAAGKAARQQHASSTPARKDNCSRAMACNLGPILAGLCGASLQQCAQSQSGLLSASLCFSVPPFASLCLYLPLAAPGRASLLLAALRSLAKPPRVAPSDGCPRTRCRP